MSGMCVETGPGEISSSTKKRELIMVPNQLKQQFKIIQTTFSKQYHSQSGNYSAFNKVTRVLYRQTEVQQLFHISETPSFDLWEVFFGAKLFHNILKEFCDTKKWLGNFELEEIRKRSHSWWQIHKYRTNFNKQY